LSCAYNKIKQEHYHTVVAVTVKAV